MEDSGKAPEKSTVSNKITTVFVKDQKVCSKLNPFAKEFVPSFMKPPQEMEATPRIANMLKGRDGGDDRPALPDFDANEQAMELLAPKLLGIWKESSPSLPVKGGEPALVLPSHFRHLSNARRSGMSLRQKMMRLRERSAASEETEVVPTEPMPLPPPDEPEETQDSPIKPEENNDGGEEEVGDRNDAEPEEAAEKKDDAKERVEEKNDGEEEEVGDKKDVEPEEVGDKNDVEPEEPEELAEAEDKDAGEPEVVEEKNTVEAEDLEDKNDAEPEEVGEVESELSEDEVLSPENKAASVVCWVKQLKELKLAAMNRANSSEDESPRKLIHEFDNFEETDPAVREFLGQETDEELLRKIKEENEEFLHELDRRHRSDASITMETIADSPVETIQTQHGEIRLHGRVKLGTGFVLKINSLSDSQTDLRPEMSEELLRCQAPPSTPTLDYLHSCALASGNTVPCDAVNAYDPKLMKYYSMLKMKEDRKKFARLNALKRAARPPDARPKGPPKSAFGSTYKPPPPTKRPCKMALFLAATYGKPKAKAPLSERFDFSRKLYQRREDHSKEAALAENPIPERPPPQRSVLPPGKFVVGGAHSAARAAARRSANPPAATDGPGPGPGSKTYGKRTVASHAVRQKETKK